MYINIYDLNFDTLWMNNPFDYILFVAKTHRKRRKKGIKDNRSRFVGPPRTIRFRTVFTFAETKTKSVFVDGSVWRNETKREDRLVSHETSSWLHARPQEDSHVSRPDPFPLPFPASLSSTIEFLSKRVFLSLIPLVDKSRGKVRGFNAMRSE